MNAQRIPGNLKITFPHYSDDDIHKSYVKALVRKASNAKLPAVVSVLDALAESKYLSKVLPKDLRVQGRVAKYMALHACVLEGFGFRPRKAHENVANVWKRQPDTVQDALTDHRDSVSANAAYYVKLLRETGFPTSTIVSAFNQSMKSLMQSFQAAKRRKK